jgi:hypothetical protein
MENYPDEDILAALFDINAELRDGLRSLSHELAAAVQQFDRADMRYPSTAEAMRRVSLVATQVGHLASLHDLIQSLPLQLSPDSILERISDGPPANEGTACASDYDDAPPPALSPRAKPSA